MRKGFVTERLGNPQETQKDLLLQINIHDSTWSVSDVNQILIAQISHGQSKRPGKRN